MANLVEWIPQGVPRPRAGRKFDFAAASKCTYLEMLHYPGLPHYVRNQGELNDESLSGWLSKDLTQPCPSTEDRRYGSSARRQAPSGGLRLLFGVCGFNPDENLEEIYAKHHTVVPFSRESFATIEQELGLPQQFWKTMTEGSGPRAFKFSHRGDSGHLSCFVFRFTINRPSFYQLALSCNKETKLTHGLLLAKSNDHEFPRLTRGLEDSQIYCEHPLVVPALIAELVIDVCSEKVNLSDLTLNNLEESMGQHPYMNRPIGNPLELDFISTTRQINFESRKLGLDTARLRGVLLAIEMILGETEKTRSNLRPIESETTTSLPAGPDGFCIMDDIIANLVNSCKNTLTRVEYETKRTQTLISVVYQFMTQKDAKVNIQLAENSAFLARASKEDSEVMRTIAVESKKDSSAMKTIAILTMFFLPGTFLAAVFAMPFFNWDSDGSPVVKAGFKYYWAVAIPLTVLVLVVWAAAVILPWRKWLPKNQLQSGQSA